MIFNFPSWFLILESWKIRHFCKAWYSSCFQNNFWIWNLVKTAQIRTLHQVSKIRIIVRKRRKRKLMWNEFPKNNVLFRKVPFKQRIYVVLSTFRSLCLFRKMPRFRNKKVLFGIAQTAYLRRNRPLSKIRIIVRKRGKRKLMWNEFPKNNILFGNDD